MNKNFFDRYKDEIEAFNRGENYHIYRFLGAHPKENGVEFAVWAPNADRVSVCGDFNGWNGEANVMQMQDGLWYAFVENAKIADVYKYEIRKGNKTFKKADPVAFRSELRPETGSIVVPVEEGKFKGIAKGKDIYNSPMNIYEVHMGSVFMDGEEYLNYRQVADKLVPYLVEMNYNYVELMPLCEYPLDASWGYQITGYYSLTSRYGTAEDFQYFTESMHNAGIGVIMDWVPGHFCRDDHGLRQFDGGPLYESSNEKKADNPGWGTLNFDFTKPQVISYMISNAVFWLECYSIDGIRVDAVANMLYHTFGKGDQPELKNAKGDYTNLEGIAFIQKMNTVLHELYPGVVTMAEDSSAWPLVTKGADQGGLGFDFKWNMGWMNDTLSYMKLDPIYRKAVHDKLTFAMFYAFSENYVLPFSHDEVVHGKCSMVEKMPGYRVDKYAQLRALYTYMYAMPGKKLNFMGNEFGHSLEWRFYEQLEWQLLEFAEYAGMKNCVSDINYLFMKSKPFWEVDTSWDGFSWCDANNSEKSILSFARFAKNKDDFMVVVVNFTPVKYEYFPVGVPSFTDYEEIFNSDDLRYGGNNILNRGVLTPKGVSEGEMPFSVRVTLPPFGAIILKPLK